MADKIENYMRLGQLMLLIFVLLFTGCRTNERHLQRDKWVTLGTCEGNDYLIWDFFNGQVTTFDGDVYKMDLRGDSLLINENDTIVRLKFRKMIELDDTLKIVFDEGLEAILVAYDLLVSPETCLEKDSLIGNVFLPTPAIPILDDCSYYFDFISEDDVVVITVDLNKGDTLVDVPRWKLYSVDSLSVLLFKDMFCTHFFVTGCEQGSISTIHVLENKLREIALNKIYPTPRDTNTIKKILGHWELTSSNSCISSRYSSIVITQDSIFVNPGGFLQMSGVWKLDAFGQVIVTNLDEGGFHVLYMEYVDNKLVLKVNDCTYELKK